MNLSQSKMLGWRRWVEGGDGYDQGRSERTCFFAGGVG